MRSWRKNLPYGSWLIEIHVTAPPGFIPKDFTLDERFSLEPGWESDEAWRSILPSLSTSTHIRKSRAEDCLDGLGIVQHPAIGPEIVSLAFGHQLHCLVSLPHRIADFC